MRQVLRARISASGDALLTPRVALTLRRAVNASGRAVARLPPDFLPSQHFNIHSRGGRGGYLVELKNYRGRRARSRLLFIAVAVGSLSNVARAADPVRLDPVIVTATRSDRPLGNVIGDVTVLNEQDLRERNAQNLIDVLRTVPGVQFTQNGGPGKASGIFIRGANSNQTVLLIDGVRVGSATAGTPSFQNIPIDQIERIEVLRGPASSLYGADAIGGVIQVFTKSGYGAPRVSAAIGAGNLGSREATLGVRGAVANAGGTTDFAANLALNRTDAVSAIANPANASFNPDKDGFRSASGSIRLGHAFDAANKVGLDVLFADSLNHYDSSFPTANYDYRNKDRLSSYSLWTRNRLADIWTSNLRVGRSDDGSRSYGPMSSSNLASVESLFKTEQTQYTWQNDVKLGPGTAMLGVERLEQRVDSTTAFVLTRRDINSLFGGYIGDIGAFTLQANVRSDDNSQYDRKTTGQLGASYHIDDAWQLGASSGTGFRAPTFNELYFPGFANPALKPETSRSNEVFVRYAEAKLSGSLTFYRNRVSNLILSSGPNFLPVNVGKALLEGATLTTAWTSDIWSVGGSADYLSAEDASGGASNGRQLARRARFSATAFATVDWNQWQARAELTGQGNRYDNAANTVPLAGYGIVNFSGAYRFTRDLALRLRVDNLLSKTYAIAKDYGVVDHGFMLTLDYSTL